jgi:hypothetical protein
MTRRDESTVERLRLEIEKKREQMIAATKNKNLTSQLVLQYCTELDLLINQYHLMSIKTQQQAN